MTNNLQSTIIIVTKIVIVTTTEIVIKIETVTTIVTSNIHNNSISNKDSNNSNQKGDNNNTKVKLTIVTVIDQQSQREGDVKDQQVPRKVLKIGKMWQTRVNGSLCSTQSRRSISLSGSPC